MKITKSYLKQVINEEIQKLNENEQIDNSAYELFTQQMAQMEAEKQEIINGKQDKTKLKNLIKANRTYLQQFDDRIKAAEQFFINPATR